MTLSHEYHVSTHVSTNTYSKVMDINGNATTAYLKLYYVLFGTSDLPGLYLESIL